MVEQDWLQARSLDRGGFRRPRQTEMSKRNHPVTGCGPRTGAEKVTHRGELGHAATARYSSARAWYIRLSEIWCGTIRPQLAARASCVSVSI